VALRPRRDDELALRYVARSLDLVLVRQAGSAGEDRSALSSFDEAIWQRLIAAKK
jgi:hypothetical protein